MNGYDDIDLTLQHEDDIIAYEKMRAEKFPFKPKTLPVKREPEQPIESAREGGYPDWQGRWPIAASSDAMAGRQCSALPTGPCPSPKRGQQ